jgi:hypothetical protein
MQGVGPVQLTWWEFQDEADRRGGCWKPAINMEVGFERLAALVRRNGLRDGIRAYNGSGPAAERYADKVLERLRHFETALKKPLNEAAVPKTRVLIPRNWWKKFVTGDTDCNRDLLCALANVAKDLGVTIHVNSGNRTYGEQVVLYNNYLKFGHPLAARPGTSNHEGGRAADCVVDGKNIGDVPGARGMLTKRGLCLPVPGEPWHVEFGTVWKA